MNFLDVIAPALPALFLSLKVAAWATLFAAILGVATGFALAQRRLPLRNVWDSILTLPMVLPPTVLGFYLLVLLGKKSALGRWLDEWGIQLIFTWQGAVVAATLVAFPLIFKPARAAFEAVPVNLQEAARVLGLPEWRIFFRVTLPLAWRGILAGLLLGFTRALGEFGATLMVAGSIPDETQTLSISIYEAVQAGDDALAHALVLLISGVCVVILWAVMRLHRR